MPYVGEIRIFAGNYAPAGWAFCDGQSLPISENDVLYVVIGTTYGGDGQATFNLPDLRGRLPVHKGPGPGLSTRQIGEQGGVEQVTLTTQQIPIHTHPLLGTTDPGTQSNPSNLVLARTTGTDIYSGDTPLTNLNNQVVSPVGGSQPHDNLQPFLCVNFIISLFGLFPNQT